MTQSSPMDFEEEAREIANLLCTDERGNGASPWECDHISQALRRAYTAGQEDMREKAGDDCACDECASIVRSLDILSPDHEKVG